MRLITVILIVAFLPLALFAENSKEQTFWRWFESNQDDLFHFEKDKESIFDRLAAELGKVHSDLTFEFGPVMKDGTREFIISAGGIVSAFPNVEALHSAAPKLQKWKILKYRQRHLPLHTLEFGERRIKADDIHYAIFKDEDPKKIGIIVFLKDYPEDKEDAALKQIGYLFLDQALGEYDVEIHVGAIVFQNRKSKYYKQASPFSRLPSQFDQLLGRREHSKPSSSK
jgi:hypothetical protein